MIKILLIHGPNLNMLGTRDARHYGEMPLPNLEAAVKKQARDLNVSVTSFQSNHEGRIIDFLQKHKRTSHGIIINAGALTHYSYSLHDALLDADLPAIEVHLSNIAEREEWRKKSVIAPACKKVIAGKKEKGYFEALTELVASLT